MHHMPSRIARIRGELISQQIGARIGANKRKGPLCAGPCAGDRKEHGKSNYQQIDGG
jgi:hypothetical protein